MDASDPKRRKLNYDKCTFCRKDKKRCDPPNRQWPQKCDRCESMGLDCSENRKSKTTKPSSETADGGLSWNSGNDGNNESQILRECQNLYEPGVKAHLHPLNEYSELELSWIRHYQNYTARVQSIIKAEDTISIDKITELDVDVEYRKIQILRQVSHFLGCPSPLVRQAALSVVSRLTSRRPAEYAENEVFESVDTLRTLLESLKSSDRIDIELSVRERLLRAMFVRKAHHQDMVESVRVYCEACERYLLRVEQLRSRQPLIFSYDESILPFSGDTQMLSLVMQYCPDILFRRRDSRWMNALAAAILSAEQKDIEQLFQNMEDAVFLELVTTKPNAYAILHTAAVRGTNCVFDRLRALDRDKIKSEINLTDANNMTPLSHAAANGNSTIVEILLELGADPNVTDDEKRVALHHAARNGNEDIVRQLLLRDPGLCTRRDDDGDTPATLAIQRGHHRVTKVFFSQPCRSLFENKEEAAAADIWMRLLELAFWFDYPQVVELLCYDQFVGQIDQTSSRTGRTALSLAASAGHLDAVKFLLSRGADARIADNDGETPCDHARRNGYHKVVSVLEGSLPPATSQ